MQLVYENNASTPSKLEINLICVFRDEEILLPHFINYYKALGVTRFFFIDNNSRDKGPEYIKSRKDINCKLLHTQDSFRNSKYGTVWQNICMRTYCQNQFCLRVDADELLYIDSRAHSSLEDLIKHMESEDKTAAPAVLLDIYPHTLNNDYQSGDPFSKHSFYFDDWNPDFYSTHDVIYHSFYWLEGGLRARTLNTSNIIHKFPIVRYIFNEKTVQPNPHFFDYNNKHVLNAPKIRLTQHPAILLHYKFIKPDFLDFLKQQIANNEHWNNSQEYKKYYETLSSKRSITFYDEKFSRKLDIQSPELLEKFWSINKQLL